MQMKKNINYYSYNDFASVVYQYRNGDQSQEICDSMVREAQKLTSYAYWGDLKEQLIKDGKEGMVKLIDKLVDASFKLTPKTPKELFDEFKEVNAWVVVDFETYEKRMKIIQEIQTNYPYDYELYEHHDGPTEIDAKGLSEEEWKEALKEFTNHYPMRLYSGE